ncbi:glutamate racemase [Alkalihalobacillus alcalophilus ATCC 27647 = CGMCC 1.3604]|uniref:Glutamate racemase n=1 Tax=Alkalihalobacillus alcalophilus ATCC 27647 = CGMCC 1.3604 TaxID=1218173 RepID=A0A094WK30_ALKAL|nr:glutamate racemase [Alkalihalobacillus alcalophilus]KGA98129.1 glutamate racemase [Alkalihalobacillus alcalophilus ATCC 27647 = CGMCC 1.3604]MED1563547.1 glutamate racemase [Alkalihalobacillus alcalophilus]THG89029.1 glutamate racemase [Alkalihalobacillus alcalophilus ATCC 27647 = CGMCC 1.3604]
MNKPIGVIDSGLGGLTVAKELLRQLPKEEIIYIGDSARCPYGPRTPEEVREFTWQMINRLVDEGIKMLVIACNTAAAVVLKEVSETLTIPTIGVVHPGAVSALKVTQNDHVAIIGTEGTIKSQAYEKELMAINSQIEIESLACPAFVPLVESGIFRGETATEVVNRTLSTLKGKKFDTLILGCTHYPLLKEPIQEAVGQEVRLISSGEETAREVSSLLYYQGLLYTGKRVPKHRFYTTGEAAQFKLLADQWLEMNVECVEHMQLID